MVMESQHDEHFCPDDSPVKAKPPKQEGTGDDCPPLKKRRLDGKQNFVEGTALGDGTRLVSQLLVDTKLAIYYAHRSDDQYLIPVPSTKKLIESSSSLSEIGFS